MEEFDLAEVEEAPEEEVVVGAREEGVDMLLLGFGGLGCLMRGLGYVALKPFPARSEGIRIDTSSTSATKPYATLPLSQTPWQVSASDWSRDLDGGCKKPNVARLT